jgi:hypothetical protein
VSVQFRAQTMTPWRVSAAPCIFFEHIHECIRNFLSMHTSHMCSVNVSYDYLELRHLHER